MRINLPVSLILAAVLVLSLPLALSAQSSGSCSYRGSQYPTGTSFASGTDTVRCSQGTWLTSSNTDICTTTRADRGEYGCTVASSGSVTCPALTRDLSFGDTDARKGGEVSVLQRFLAQDSSVYPEAAITGFFGYATERAVQRWQEKNGIVSSGDRETTGYGAVGPRTRAAMRSNCGSSTGDLTVTPASGAAPLSVTISAPTVEAKMNSCVFSIGFFGHSGNGLSVNWGDGTQSPIRTDANKGQSCTSAVKNHTYTAPGTYTIKVTSWHPGPTDEQVTDWEKTATVTVSAASTGGGSCLAITHNLGLEDTDAQTGGDVSRLQRFLAQNPSIYPEGLITGFYGPATMRAVQRWQRTNGVASSGTPETTGYGYVGPKTRAAMGCGGTSTGALSATPTTGAAPLSVTFSARSEGALSVDFGDGQAAAMQVTAATIFPPESRATHIYAAAGTYTATLYRGNPQCVGLTGAAAQICEIGQREVLGTATIVVSGQGTTGGVTVSSPAAGAQLVYGQSTTVNWASSVQGSSVVLDLYSGLGVKIGTFAISSNISGSTSWVVPLQGSGIACTMQYPNGLCGASIPAGSYKIRATVMSGLFGQGNALGSGESGLFSIGGTGGNPDPGSSGGFRAVPSTGLSPLRVSFLYPYVVGGQSNLYVDFGDPNSVSDGGFGYERMTYNGTTWIATHDYTAPANVTIGTRGSPSGGSASYTAKLYSGQPYTQSAPIGTASVFVTSPISMTCSDDGCIITNNSTTGTGTGTGAIQLGASCFIEGQVQYVNSCTQASCSGSSVGYLVCRSGTWRSY